jgi:hypothetical protein
MPETPPTTVVNTPERHANTTHENTALNIAPSTANSYAVTSLCAKSTAQKRIAELHSNLFDEWNQTVTV